MQSHKSVLLKEVLQWSKPGPGQLMVDGTIGRAGHASAILELTAPNGLLIGFDKDPEAVKESSKILQDYGERVMIFHEDFKAIASRLGSLDLKADGVFLDLGVSSPQLDEPARGFSFKTDGPLDMRMNPEQPSSAADVVNQYSEQALSDIFWKYGEERFSRRIAEKIVEHRRAKPIKTTSDLESVVWNSVPASYKHGRIHPATRVFQAIRIEVNQEIAALEIFLATVLDVLKPGGKIVIISFHSLEDRVVKNAFKQFYKDGAGRIMTKKPVTAASAEISDNPRSRSAKLRAFEKS